MKKLEAEYLRLFWKREKYQWEKYADSKKHNLNRIDSGIYNVLKKYKDIFLNKRDRWGKVFYSIFIRDFVDKSPSIARLRNYIDKQLISSKSVMKKDRARLAKIIRPHIISLINLRNKKARELGYRSYPELVFDAEELNISEVVSIIDHSLRDNAVEYQSLLKKHGFCNYDEWFKVLRSIAAKDSYFIPTILMNNIAQVMGFANEIPKLKLIIKEQPISGYAGILKVPNDIRILIKPDSSIYGRKVLCHELGHALTHLFNKEKGIYQTWTTCFDEVMAVLIERVCFHKTLLKRGLNTLNAEQLFSSYSEVKILENTRCAISFLFELALYNDLEKPEELYIKYYSRLNIDLDNPEYWVLDTFRSIDPIYIHNYVLGDVLAKTIINILEKKVHSEPNTAWGDWMISKFYHDGRRRSLKSKIEAVGASLINQI